MGLEHKIDMHIEYIFTGKTKIQQDKATLVIDAKVEMCGEEYGVGDYIRFKFYDDIDLQASEGHINILEMIGKLQAINYNPNLNNIIFDFDGVRYRGSPPGKNKKYEQSEFFRFFAPSSINEPEKITKKEYDLLIKLKS